MPSGVGLAIGGAALAGGALNAFGKSNPTFDNSFMNNIGQGQVNGAYGSLQNALNATGGKNATNDYANMLQEYMRSGGVPSGNDVQSANQFAQSQFAPQQTALKQTFQDQLTQANNQAALSGRGVNDPILKAKLAQEQSRQSTLLNSQQGAFASQYANQLSQNRLGYAEGRANVLTNQDQLGIQNASSLFNAALANNQNQFNQQYNLSRANYQQQSDATSFGQRLGSTINAGIAGVGTGLGASAMLNSFQAPSSYLNSNYAQPVFGSSFGQSNPYTLGSFKF